MPQLYTSQLTAPAEHKAVSIRFSAAVAGGVVTLTCSNAAGSDVVIIHNSGTCGVSKANFQLVGDSAPANPTVATTEDATGIILPWQQANLPMLFYVSRTEGYGKKKILAVRVYTTSASGQVYAQFIDLKTGTEING